MSSHSPQNYDAISSTGSVFDDSDNGSDGSSDGGSDNESRVQEIVRLRPSSLHGYTDGGDMDTAYSHVSTDGGFGIDIGEVVVITVDDAIERLGMGKFQIRVLVAAGLCFAADAMQVLLLSFLSVVLKADWHLTGKEAAAITSFLFAGAMTGTLVLGPYADVKGRKPTFFVASVTITVSGFAVCAVHSYVVLLAMYFIVGFGVGGLTVPFDILAELLPADSRGKNLLLIEYFWTGGVLFVVLFAHMTLGPKHGDNWRLFVALSAIPCFVSIFLGYLFVPESPRWLATQGRCPEAMGILRRAASVNGLSVDEVFPPHMQLAQEEEESSDFRDLFKPQWLPTILRLWGTWGLYAFGYYGTILAITSLFASSTPTGTDDNGGGSNKDVVDFDYGAIFVSSSAEFLGTTFAIIFVDRAGRIPLQMVSYAMAGISVFSLCVLADRGYSRTLLIAFAFLARIFEMSGSCVSWVSTAEILTTEVRTTGHSSANAVARIGALISPFVVEGSMPLVKMGVVMLAIHMGTVFFVSQLPETAGSHMGGGVAETAHLSVMIDDEIEHRSASPETSLDGADPDSSQPLQQLV